MQRRSSSVLVQSVLEKSKSAVALNSIRWQGSRMIFPAIGGLLIALTDTSLIFVICGIGFITMVVVLFSIELEQIIQDKTDPSRRDC